jgi:hypothetical protein
MFDFLKRKAKPPVVDDAPPGEDQMLLQVRTLCKLAKGSAEAVVQGDEDEEMALYERDRYTRMRNQALKITRNISDEFYKNTALHSIIDLCMTANDVQAAQTLFKHMSAVFIKERIVKEHPRIKARF